MAKNRKKNKSNSPKKKKENSTGGLSNAEAGDIVHAHDAVVAGTGTSAPSIAIADSGVPHNADPPAVVEELNSLTPSDVGSFLRPDSEEPASSVLNNERQPDANLTRYLSNLPDDPGISFPSSESSDDDDSAGADLQLLAEVEVVHSPRGSSSDDEGGKDDDLLCSGGTNREGTDYGVDPVGDKAVDFGEDERGEKGDGEIVAEPTEPSTRNKAAALTFGAVIKDNNDPLMEGQDRTNGEHVKAIFDPEADSDDTAEDIGVDEADTENDIIMEEHTDEHGEQVVEDESGEAVKAAVYGGKSVAAAVAAIEAGSPSKDVEQTNLLDSGTGYCYATADRASSAQVSITDFSAADFTPAVEDIGSAEEAGQDNLEEYHSDENTGLGNLQQDVDDKDLEEFVKEVEDEKDGSSGEFVAAAAVATAVRATATGAATAFSETSKEESSITAVVADDANATFHAKGSDGTLGPQGPQDSFYSPQGSHDSFYSPQGSHDSFYSPQGSQDSFYRGNFSKEEEGEEDQELDHNKGMAAGAVTAGGALALNTAEVYEDVARVDAIASAHAPRELGRWANGESQDVGNLERFYGNVDSGFSHSEVSTEGGLDDKMPLVSPRSIGSSEMSGDPTTPGSGSGSPFQFSITKKPAKVREASLPGGNDGLGLVTPPTDSSNMATSPRSVASGASRARRGSTSSEKLTARRLKRRIILVSGGLLLLAGIVALALGLSQGLGKRGSGETGGGSSPSPDTTRPPNQPTDSPTKPKNTLDPTTRPTPSPTMRFISSPTDATESEQVRNLRVYLESIVPIPSTLSDPNTPQHSAMEWLASNSGLKGYDETTIQQRYGLAAFYFSAGGNGWEGQILGNDNGGWLSDEDECLWLGVSCGPVVIINRRAAHSEPTTHLRGGRRIQSQRGADGITPTGELEIVFEDVGPDSESNDLSADPTTSPSSKPTRTAAPTPSLTTIAPTTPPTTIAPTSYATDAPSSAALTTSVTDAPSSAAPTTGMPTKVQPTGLPTSKPTAQLQQPPRVAVTALELWLLNLSGRIPPDIALLASLQKLELYSNSLSSTIPTELGLLSQLESCHLDSNLLSGTIPSQLFGMARLVELRLDENKLTSIPGKDIGTVAKESQIEILRLDDNELTGQIPKEFGQLTSLKELRLDSNSLSGTLAKELFAELENIVELNVAANAISGSLPPQVGNLLKCQELRFEGNIMQGPIPTEVGLMENLVELRLDGGPGDNGGAGNMFSGPLPSELGRLKSLAVLYAQDNELRGSIPTELGAATSLEALYLHNNKFSSTVPSEIGSLMMLEELYLDGNDLSGTVPEEICMLRDPGVGGVLEDLTSDCSSVGDEPAKIECSCCTECYFRVDGYIDMRLGGGQRKFR